MALVKCGSCGNEVSSDAAACPKCGKPVKKKMGIVKMLLIGMGGLFALCIIGSVAGAGSKEKGSTPPTKSAAVAAPTPSSAPAPTAPTPTPSATPEPTPAAAAAPAAPAAPAEPAWVADRRAACQRYKDAPNEIKKSSVFSDYFAGLKGKNLGVEKLTGTVAGIETPQGGNEVWLKVETPYGTFTNNDALQSTGFSSSTYDIKKGSPLYKAIGDLSEGAQVTVTLSNVIASKNPFSEQMGVCGDDWIAKFAKVEAAK